MDTKNDTSTPEPIIGQEAITPDGLGRVTRVDESSKDFTEVHIEFHVEVFNRFRRAYRLSEVELIDPRGMRPAPPLPMPWAVSKCESCELIDGCLDQGGVMGDCTEYKAAKIPAAYTTPSGVKIPFDIDTAKTTDGPTSRDREVFAGAIAQVRQRLQVERDDAGAGVVFVFDDILEWLDDLTED